MASLEFVVSRDPRSLLESAADEFLVPRQGTPADPFPSPSYLLALRQGGLRDDLIRLAAERAVPGWFDPPMCIFHELPEWFGATGRRPLGDFERLVLIAHVLERTAKEVLGRVRHMGAFLDAVDRFFGELAGEGVTAETFASAVQRVEHREQFEEARDRELAATYEAYLDVLARDGLRDGRDTLVDCAQAIAADADALAERLGGRRAIRFVGLHDLRGGWRHLLDALRSTPVLDRVAVYVADERDLDLGLAATVRRLDDVQGLGARVFTATSKNGARVQIVAAPDAAREVEEIAVRVRRLAEAGVPLERIAVVARKARPYVDRAVTVLETIGVPASARLRVAFTEIPVLRSLGSLFAAAAEGWTRHALAELAEQPYVASDLDASLFNLVGYRRQVRGLDNWERALSDLEMESRAREVEGPDAERRELGGRLPAPGRVRRARAAFRRFARIGKGLDESRSLLGWAQWLEDLLVRDPFGITRRIYEVPDRRFHLARVDLAGWKAVELVVEEWRAALERWGHDGAPLAAAQFFERLQGLLSGDAAFWTETRRGVQVLEGLAALYRPFDHLFLIGMEAGSFPARPPSSPILGEIDRRALRDAGLPLELEDLWESRERSLLRILLAGAGSVTLSYPALDETGRELLPSSFVEAVAAVAHVDRTEIPASRVVTPGYPLLMVPEMADEVERAATIEAARAAGIAGPYDGAIRDPDLVAWLNERYDDQHVWSPTQLEQYAKCPWAWFSQRLLRLGRLEDPDEQMDPLVRGRILHDALRRFFERAAERAGGPVFLRTSDLEWAEPLARTALDEALAEAEPHVWLGHELLREAVREELRRIMVGYLRWEVRDVNERSYNKRTKAAQMVRTGAWMHECAFADATLERDGIAVRYRGAIDRVDRGVDERVESGHLVAAIDYKSSQAATPGMGDRAAWDDGVVLQVPLYAHALAHLQPGAAVARVEYRALRRPNALHQLQLHQIEKKSHTLFRSPEDVERMDRALDQVPRYVRAIRGGEFPVRPAPSCGCPPFCHARDICRIPGGPRAKRERRFK
jgi:RecB family exonuclease